MRKKSDSQLLAEAYEGSVSQGGPLGSGGSSPSTYNSTTNEQGEEDGDDSLMALVAKLLAGVADGSIDEGEACEHVKMVLSGEVEASEHESKEEQEKEDEGDYSDHEEDAEDNTKRYSGEKNTREMEKGLRLPSSKSPMSNKPGNPKERTQQFRKTSGVNRKQPTEGRY